MIFRKAVFQDVEAIYTLVNHFAGQGLMLARSRNVLYESLMEMTVAEADGKIVGAGSLHMTWDALAEIRAMAVAPELQKQGVGRRIVGMLEREAAALGVKTLFTLTYQPGFFQKLGFAEVPKESLHHKVWKECINCPKFPNCDEVAMTKMAAG